MLTNVYKTPVKELKVRILLENIISTPLYNFNISPTLFLIGSFIVDSLSVLETLVVMILIFLRLLYTD